MHISSIVLHGFKSFGKKSTIKLGRGITGVVGPNGCGKTNIVDALRWVLGEQKQSVIRAGRMEEIIFNGSSRHKPSSLCEVSVTIHNDKEKLPTEYTDVEITRRLYRDGESEYLINRQPCRLKDITDLFIDTGMGSDAYSVIELKMVEDILSETGEDRRRMFEEAAGVNKYKKQRASTFRKLEATRLDLERINDIAGEVGGKVKSLQLQLKRFDRHRKLTESLSDLELTLARLKVHAISEKKAPLLATLQAAKSSRSAEADELGQQEKALGSAQESLKELEVQYQAANSLLEGANNELNDSRRQSAVWAEQIKASDGALARIATEGAREERSIVERQASIEQLSKQMEDLVPGTEEHRALLTARQAEEIQFTSAFKSAEVALEESREKHFRHRQQLLEVSARHQRSVELIAEKETAAAKLQEEVRTADEQVHQQHQRLALLETELNDKETAGAALEANAKRGAVELERLRKVLDEAKDEANAAGTQLKLHESQLSMLQRMAGDHEGYPAGTQAILSNMDSHAGVLGTVADLAQLQGDHARAVEAALGSVATALVVRTADEARALLDAVRQNRLGRLSVIPLDRIAGPSQVTSPVGLTPLADLITAEPDLLPLYRALLDGVYFSPSDGEPDGGDLKGGSTIITASGNRYGNVPLWTHSGGGAEDESGPTASLVGRAAEIEKLSRDLESSRLNLQDAEKKLQDVREQIQNQEREDHEREIIIADSRSALVTIKEETSQIRYQQEQANKGVTAGREKLPRLDTEIELLKESLKSQSETIEALQNKEQGLKSTTEAAQDKFTRAQQQMEQYREELQEHRVALINLENDREKLAERKLSTEDLLQAGTQRLATLAEEKVATEGVLAGLKDKVTKAALGEKGLLDKVDMARATTAKAENQARTAREAISEKEAELRGRQRQRESELGDLQSRELSLEQLKQEEVLIRSRITELYGKSVGKLQESDSDLEESSLQREVEASQRSLERIGPVNMAVSEEHKAEMDRLAFLTDQRDDLKASEETLLETIEKIDHRAREQFQTTYDSIRHHFKQTFTMFFEGGLGDLRLVGDPDPLESDIEIIAVPPGKKTRTLRSLSAGEKALTSIALLFAIYMVKPSPYCILDEVDAPLDDINIGKFSKVISQFSKETQFIVVTHNKLSMEQADYLYGVTMAEEGLSTLVSVDLRQYAA